MIVFKQKTIFISYLNMLVTDVSFITYMLAMVFQKLWGLGFFTKQLLLLNCCMIRNWYIGISNQRTLCLIKISMLSYVILVGLVFYKIINTERVFVEHLNTCLPKLLEIGTILIKLIFGVLEFYCMKVYIV